MALTRSQKNESDLRKRFNAEARITTSVTPAQVQAQETREEEVRGYESVIGHALRTEGPRVASLVASLGLSR